MQKNKIKLAKKPILSLSELLNQVKGGIFSSQALIGIDIGFNYVKLVYLQSKGKKYLLHNYRVRVIPLTARENPQQRQEFICRVIEEFIKEGKIKVPLGGLAIWGAGTFVFTLNIPANSEKEIKDIIDAELKKKLPFHIDLSNIVYDYYITDKLAGEKNTTFYVTCIAVNKYTIEEHMRLLFSVGVRPLYINIIPEALGNVVKLVDEGKKHVAVLDIGAKEAICNFYHQGMLQFSRQIPVGGDHISQAVVKAMNMAGMAEATIEHAERLKRQCGIPLEEDALVEYFTDFGTIKATQISAALRPLFERFSIEISRTISYYYRTFRVKNLDVLYLTGGSSRMKNLDNFLLSHLTHLHVEKIERLNPLKAVKGWTDTNLARQDIVMEEAIPHLSAAFGVAMGRGKINLLPAKERMEQKLAFFAGIMKILFVFFLALIFIATSIVYSTSHILKKNLANTEKELNQLKPFIDKANEFLAKKAILTERRSLLEHAIGNQPLWHGILKELSFITPQGIALRTLTIEKKDKQFYIFLRGDVIAEYTTINLTISQFFSALDESPFFTQVKPPSTKRDMYSAIPKATFDIQAILVY